MAADVVQAIFSGASPGTDLSAFAPSVGSGLTRHPAYSSNAAIATASKRFRAGAAGSDVVYFDGTAPATADYKVRAKLTALTLTGSDIAGPIIRCSTNADSFYTFTWINYNGLAAGLALFKHINGTPSLIGSPVNSVNGSSVVPTSGTSAVLEIAVSGTTIIGSFNGVAAITATDPNLTAAGFGGLYLYCGVSDDGSGIQAEEFDINDPTVSTPTPTPTPSMSVVNPVSLTVGVHADVTLQGTGTSWTGSTGFGLAGIAGAGFSGTFQLDSAKQIAIIGTNPGTSTGILTFSENSNNTTASIPVYSSTPTPTPPPSVVLSVTSGGHWCSPLNWDDDGSGAKLANGARAGATSIWSACNGAEGRFSWTTPVGSNNVATLGIDTSSLIAGSIPPGSFPKVKYRINDGAYHVAQIQPGTNGVSTLDVSAAGVGGAGTYTLRYFLMATSQAQPRWTPAGNGPVPPNSLKVTGLTVDAGSTPVSPSVLPRTLVVFGDSLTEGVEASGTNNGDLVSNDSTLVYARALAASLGAELGAIGFGAQGWERAGGGGVAPFSTSFGSYSAGRQRDFSPPVDDVLCTHGTNDGLAGTSDQAVTADSAAWLALARTKFGPKTNIFLCVPFGGFKRAALTAGFAQYQATTPDTAAFFLDGGAALQAGLTAFVTGGTWVAPGDGIHPDASGHARIAAMIGEAIGVALEGAVPPPPPPPVLPAPSGPLQASGVTFTRLRSGGLSGQIDSVIAANPTLDPVVVVGLHAGRNGALDKTYQGLSSLVESYLHGDPIATADVNDRLVEYATVFAGYAQSAAEIGALIAANPGTIVTLPTTPHAVNPTQQRSFG